MKVRAEVDSERRSAIMFNHSATHLLQAALRKVLGDHVQQAGSHVDEHRLRFDFKHYAPMTDEEIRAVEQEVNSYIWQLHRVNAEVMSLDEARKKGALAFFEEKYGQTVRIISMGDVSMEFCGGTHLENTGRIGLFRIISETGIAASMRRIEATTNEKAWELSGKDRETLHNIGSLLKTQSADEIIEKINSMLREKKELEQKLEQERLNKASTGLDSLIDNAPIIEGARIVTGSFKGMTNPELRGLADRIIDRVNTGLAILGADHSGKAALVVKVSQDLCKRVHAGNLIREIAPLVEGSGGGKPNMAQAGGKAPQNLQQALEKGLDLAKEMLA